MLLMKWRLDFEAGHCFCTIDAPVYVIKRLDVMLSPFKAIAASTPPSPRGTPCLRSSTVSG